MATHLGPDAELVEVATTSVVDAELIAGEWPTLAVEVQEFDGILHARGQRAERRVTEGELCLVVPVTSRGRDWPNHLELPTSAGLGRPSWAMSEQIRVISRSRLLRRTGIVDAVTLESIRAWIRDSLL